MNTHEINVGTPTSSQLQLSVITSIVPDVLSKTYGYRDGKLQKTPGGDIVKGHVLINSFSTPEEFCAVLTGLEKNQALCASLPNVDDANIVTKKTWMERGRPEGVLTRTKQHFSFASGEPGLLTLDCDEGGHTLESLMGILVEACPAAEFTSAVGWASASSFLYRDNEPLTEGKGWRIWLFVNDAGDIERAGQILLKRLWLKGHGSVAISSAGSLLVRNIFDASMWQAARLDFAAGAICRDGIEQRRGSPEVLSRGGLLDTRAALPDLDKDQESEYQRLVSEAKVAKRSTATQIKDAWITQRVPKILKSMSKEKTAHATEEDAQEVLSRALGFELIGEFQIKLEDGREVSVRDVLENPAEFNQLLTYDPLEPEYQDGKIVGILYLHGTQPVLYSQAHGGQTFRLFRQQITITLKQGDEYAPVKETADALSGHIWKCGGRVGIVESGAFHAHSHVSLNHDVARACRYIQMKPLTSGGVRVGSFPERKGVPKYVSQTICEYPTGELVQEIEGVRSAPLMDMEGQIREVPGFDALSGWFLDFDEDDWTGVPLHPSIDEVEDAIRRLYMPISKFPYASPDDRAVALAAMMTSAFRPVLERAPGIGLDANLQGSGKSKLAQCIGVLGAGNDGYRMIPFSMGMDDNEIRKQIGTNVRAGSAVCCLDNLMGSFDSGALASFLAPEAAKFNDRALHSQDSLTGSHRQLFMVTGNNLCLRGELPRRFIVCRLDARTEDPISRIFDFEPVDFVKSVRMRLLADCFTIYRGWLEAGRPMSVTGQIGSYEVWSSSIRQCVMWAGQLLGEDVEVGDPAARLLENVKEDPAREDDYDLLSCLKKQFGDQNSFTARKVIDVCNSSPYEELACTLKDMLRHGVSARSVGRLFGQKRDKPVRGLKLITRSEASDGGKEWVLVMCGR